MSSRRPLPALSTSSPTRTENTESPSAQLSLSPDFDPPPSGHALQVLASILDAEATAAKQHRLKKKQQAKKLAHPNPRKPRRERFFAVRTGYRS